MNFDLQDRNKQNITNLLFTDSKRLLIYQCSKLLLLIFEIFVIIFGFVCIFDFFDKDNDNFIFLFFTVFSLIHFIKADLTFLELKKCLNTNDISEVEMQMFSVEKFLAMFTDILMFPLTIFGAMLIKIHFISPSYTPDYIINIKYIIIFSFLPFFINFFFHVFLFLILNIVLRRIPVKKFSELNEQGGECSICLKSYENDDLVKIFQCNHFFHKNCIDDWLRHDRTCPFCRICPTKIW